MKKIYFNKENLALNLTALTELLLLSIYYLFQLENTIYQILLFIVLVVDVYFLVCYLLVLKNKGMKISVEGNTIKIWRLYSIKPYIIKCHTIKSMEIIKRNWRKILIIETDTKKYSFKLGSASV